MYRHLSRSIASVIARLRPFIGERRRFPRYQTSRSVRLFDVSNREANTYGDQALLPIAGMTRDLSETGLAIYVPSNPLRGDYPRVVGRLFRIVLDLPTGLVEIRATAVRCERCDRKEIKEAYLIALQITEMSDKDWTDLVRYIRELNLDTGTKLPRN